MPDLFTPFQLGDLTLPNRMVMAPMTRDRAGPGNVPVDIMATYYAQRASAGLIVTEGTPPDAMGQGYLRVPGLYTDAQVAGWRRVTDSVHAAGGRIFVQLMYVGRISHPSFLGGATPVSASAVRADAKVFTDQGPTDCVTPRALETHEIPGVIATFGRAAELSNAAGFDGVELHATSGYLPAQFLLPTINRRTDAWGGSVEKRARFLLEATDAMIAARGAGRVGVRIGPEFPYNDAHDPNPRETYGHVAEQLAKRGIGYLHVVDMHGDWDLLGFLRERFPGPIIANQGYDRAKADAEIGGGRAELVSFGASFLANPDLPERFRRGAALNTPDKDTFYSDGPKGYIDYPALAVG